MFRVSQHPSSGVLKTVTAASGTGHNDGTATSLQRGPDRAALEALEALEGTVNYDARNNELKKLKYLVSLSQNLVLDKQFAADSHPITCLCRHREGGGCG